MFAIIPRIINSGNGGIMATLISVVVPFHNEEANVEPLAAEIREALAVLTDFDYECVFVNDASSDGTAERIDALAGSDPRVRGVHLRVNQGQSAALVAGMQRARGAYILTLDGDLQNDPADFPRILEMLEEYDCVFGYRSHRRDTWVRRWSSVAANRIRMALLWDGIRDAGCGTKGFRRACVAYVPPFNGAHRFMGALMRAAGFSVAQCPVNHRPRLHGTSNYGVNNRLWRSIYDLIGVRWLCRRYVRLNIKEEE